MRRPARSMCPSGLLEPSHRRQPVEHEVVTHGLGTNCYPCHRAGQFYIVAEDRFVHPSTIEFCKLAAESVFEGRLIWAPFSSLGRISARGFVLAGFFSVHSTASSSNSTMGSAIFKIVVEAGMLKAQTGQDNERTCFVVVSHHPGLECLRNSLVRIAGAARCSPDQTPPLDADHIDEDGVASLAP